MVGHLCLRNFYQTFWLATSRVQGQDEVVLRSRPHKRFKDTGWTPLLASHLIGVHLGTFQGRPLSTALQGAGSGRHHKLTVGTPVPFRGTSDQDELDRLSRAVRERLRRQPVEARIDAQAMLQDLMASFLQCRWMRFGR